MLVICPTRGRPSAFKNMLDSFLENSRFARLTVHIDSDDPCVEEYREIIKGRCSFTIGERENITQIINAKFHMAKPHEFYSITNDDFFYHTKDWDLKLIEEIKLHGKYGIAYGNDLLQGVNMPTTSVISGEIARAVGWLQLPSLIHLFGDNVWQFLGKKTGCLHYRSDVIIEHRHWFSKKVPQDEVYRHTNSKAMYDADHKAFVEWFTQTSKSDAEKIIEVIKAGVAEMKSPCG